MPNLEPVSLSLTHFSMSSRSDHVKAEMPTRASGDGKKTDDVSLETQSDVVEKSAVDPAQIEEKALVRKLDKRILPIVCLLYLFAFLDRSNLGNARLQGMPEDVLGGDPTGELYDWISSAFFFTYIICQTPATILSKLFPPRMWVAGAAMGWGLCGTLMATTFNFQGMITTRVFLGVFESGFGPAIPLYLSFFYTKEEIGLRMAYWFGFAAVAGAFGGLIAFGVQHIEAHVANWRLLFIIEGLPSVILGAVCMFLLPNRPESTTFLNERERKLAVERMNRHGTADTGAVLKKAHILMGLTDWRVYLGATIYFGYTCAVASISAFLPTMIQTLGYNNARAQLLTVPPYATSAVCLVTTSMMSDRMQHRGTFMAASSAIAGVGYVIMLATSVSSIGARYFATFCIVSGSYTAIGLIIAWFAHNLGSESKKATGVGLFMSLGQGGSILGSHIYPKTEGPRYIKGFAIICALEFIAMIGSIILSASYMWENSRRDKLYGKPEPGVKVNTDELADKAPDYRYVS